MIAAGGRSLLDCHMVVCVFVAVSRSLWFSWIAVSRSNCSRSLSVTLGGSLWSGRSAFLAF